MSGAERTAREQRETRRAETSRALARLLVDADLPHAEIARLIGVSETIVHEWCDPTKARALAVADAMALPAPVRIELAELLAGDGYLVVRAPVAGAAADIAHAITVQRETGEVVASHLEALADGVVVGPEATRVRREIREAMRALAELDAAMEVAERERVVGLRAVRGE